MDYAGESLEWGPGDMSRDSANILTTRALKYDNAIYDFMIRLWFSVRGTGMSVVGATAAVF